MTRPVCLVPFVAYIGTVYGANWALKEFGFIHIGFGLTAPAGVLFAGLAFTFRDLTHEALGRWWCIVAILVGAALSYVLADVGRIAVASAIAFSLSELADLVVYEPLRRRHWLGAVAISNFVGLIVDSALFLWLALGSLNFIEGQIVGKAYMTVLAIAALWAWRKCAVLSRNASSVLAE
jgi:hypothetical protein